MDNALKGIFPFSNTIWTQIRHCQFGNKLFTEFFCLVLLFYVSADRPVQSFVGTLLTPLALLSVYSVTRRPRTGEDGGTAPRFDIAITNRLVCQSSTVYCAIVRRPCGEGRVRVPTFVAARLRDCESQRPCFTTGMF